MTGYVVGSVISGVIAGAIGAAVADASRSHPVIKGALTVGAINGVLALATYSAFEAGVNQKQLSAGTTQGLGEPFWP